MLYTVSYQLSLNVRQRTTVSLYTTRSHNFRVPELSSYHKKIRYIYIYQEILSLFEALRVISTVYCANIQWKVYADSWDWCQSKRLHPQRATFKGWSLYVTAHLPQSGTEKDHFSRLLHQVLYQWEIALHWFLPFIIIWDQIVLYLLHRFIHVEFCFSYRVNKCSWKLISFYKILRH